MQIHGSQRQALPADSVIADSRTADKMVVEDSSAVGDTISGSSPIPSQPTEAAPNSYQRQSNRNPDFSCLTVKVPGSKG